MQVIADFLCHMVNVKSGLRQSVSTHIWTEYFVWELLGFFEILHVFIREEFEHLDAGFRIHGFSSFAAVFHGSDGDFAAINPHFFFGFQRIEFY